MKTLHFGFSLIDEFTILDSCSFVNSKMPRGKFSGLRSKNKQIERFWYVFGLQFVPFLFFSLHICIIKTEDIFMEEYNKRGGEAIEYSKSNCGS